MNTEFDIKMTTGALYQFYMYHMYHRFAGWFNLIAAAGVFGMYLVFREDQGRSVMYLLFAVLFLVYQPLSLLSKAYKQVKLNPAFRDTLHYSLKEEGIVVCQKEAENEINWDGIWKIRETGKAIFVYTGSRNAFIWIKEQMGEQEEAVRKLLEVHIEASKIKWKAGNKTK